MLEYSYRSFTRISALNPIILNSKNLVHKRRVFGKAEECVVEQTIPKSKEKSTLYTILLERVSSVAALVKLIRNSVLALINTRRTREVFSRLLPRYLVSLLKRRWVRTVCRAEFPAYRRRLHETPLAVGSTVGFYTPSVRADRFSQGFACSGRDWPK